MAEESTFLHPARVLRAAALEEGAVVADLGVGSGFFTRAAAREVGPRGVVWAVDANRDLLERVKNLSLAEGLHNVEVLRGNLEQICGSNLPPAHADFCIVANLLFSIEHKKILADEVGRILKRGGRAIVVDWKGSFGGLGPHPAHVVGQSEALALFTAAGFAPVGELPAGEYHWGFVVRKKGAAAAQ